MYKYKTILFIVEGGIGIGKTTFIENLIKELNELKITYKLHTEDMYMTQTLIDYYKNPKENGFKFEKEIIRQRIEQLELIDKNVHINIYDRCLLSTRIFTKTQRKMGYLTKNEAKELLIKTEPYMDMFKEAEVLYLNPGIDIMKERKRKRGRESEIDMEETYLETLAQTYQKEMKNTYKRYIEENEYIKKNYESEEYKRYVKRIAKKLVKQLEQQIDHFVLNIVYKKGKIYLSQRIQSHTEYYLNHQVAGGRMMEGETIEEACLRETHEEMGLIFQKERLKHVVTEKGKDRRICEVFMTELKEGEKPETCEPDKNTEWKEYDLWKAFKGDKNILLTPTLRKYSNLIIATINQGKHNYLNTPRDILKRQTKALKKLKIWGKHQGQVI